MLDGPAGVARVREDLRAPLFCGGCDAATAAAVSRAMVAEPLAPPGTPVRLTPERFGRVEKAYSAFQNPAWRALRQISTQVTGVEGAVDGSDSAWPALDRGALAVA